MTHSTHRCGSCVVIAVIAMMLTGCAHVSLNRDYEGPRAMPPHLVAPFQKHDRAAELIKDRVTKETSRYRVRRVKLDPSLTLLGERELVIDFYELTAKGTHPLVLVLPIMGGGNEVANHFAKVFAKKGLAAAIVHRQEDYKDLEEDAEQLNLVFEQIVYDHQLALDWLTEQPSVDPERIGLFGASAGSIKGSLVYAVDDRIDAAVLALAGADLPFIFSYSSEKGIIEKRDRAMKRDGLTVEEFHQVMDAYFRYDPMTYAPYMDARDILMILPIFDRVLPHSTAKAYRTALGGPEAIYIPTGHYGSILYLPVIESAAVKFLKKRLMP